MLKKCRLVALVFSLLASVAANAFAQDDTEYVEINDIVFVEEETTDGLFYNLGMEASFNLVSNQNVVGQNDGTSILLGGGLSSGADYFSGKHVLRNSLNYNTSWARTPDPGAFVKNNDLINLESLYNYHILDWVGAFGRFNLQTSAFPTKAVSSQLRNYVITRADGSIDTTTTRALRLADPLSPLSMFQSLGLGLEPVRREAIHTTVRVGFGARQTFADGVLAIRDDAATEDVIEVLELSDAFQAGAEVFAGLEGRFPEQRIHYRVGATTLVPFINNDDTDRSAFELTRIGLVGNVRVALFDWMGLSYNVSVLNDPQLLDEVQVQNSLLLTFNYTFIDNN